ncbi:P-loop NTPase fold protein [Streptomyces umbrinus]|uniref:P-loop NTPase fold protein n=1 Tax=Streptomyces umbrinus TaxID=67370 RepID=UPI0033C4B316
MTEGAKHLSTLAWASGDGRTLERSWLRLTVNHPIWSLAFGEATDGVFLAGACADGTIRLWEAATGTPIRQLRGHTGAVLSVTVGVVNGHAALASAGIDGTVRLWDPSGGDSGHRTLQGHVGGVRAVAFGNADGHTFLASAGADGTVRLWNPETGTPAAEPLTGHSGTALSVAFGPVGDRYVLASAGDDATVRLWDAETGASLVEPLRRHRGGVRSVAFGQIDGVSLLVSSSDDGTVQLWDPHAGVPLFGRLTGHSGIVRAVSFSQIDDVNLVMSAGIDGTIRMWNPNTGSGYPDHVTAPADDLRSIVFGQVRGENVLAVGSGEGVSASRLADQIDTTKLLAPDIVRSAIVTADAIDATDFFGRVILARHLRGVIGQLIAPDGADSHRSVVVCIDGRWGSGKTTLARLLVEEMHNHAPSATLSYGQDQTMGDNSRDGAPLPCDPVVVNFDAWRESEIAPHWWAVAAAINRGVRSERSVVARIGMTVTGVGRRIARSPASLAAILFVSVVVFGFMAIRSAAPAQLNQTLTILQTFLTAGTALFAVAAVVTRSLFWASPALGRLHLRAEDNPLGEVADMVTNLRRWSPRTGSSPFVETAFFILWIIVGTIAGRRIYSSPEVVFPRVEWQVWFQSHPIAVPVAVATALTVGLAAPAAVRSTTRGPRRRARRNDGRSTARSLGPRSHWYARRSWRVISAIIVGSIVGVAGAAEIPDTTGPAWLPLFGLGAIGIAGLVAQLKYVRSLRRGNRRPIVLVMDELDRCSVPTVVAYLETVHTLLRERSPGPSFMRNGWRDPAPLVVLVLADGRWVRTAFTTEYDAFKELGSPVRTLGGDFLQKLFDHTVLVPELTAEHVGHLLDRITSPVTSADALPGEQVAAVPSSVSDAESQGRPPRQTETEASGADPVELDAERERIANEALAAATPKAIKRREAHLLASYTMLLPSNPRLIRRVANTWAMLEALKQHVGHDEPDDTVVRAAIIYVTFPSLVDALLDDVRAPTVPDQIDDSVTEADHNSLWLRPDVLGIITHEDGTLVSPESIARCYGKAYSLTRNLTFGIPEQPDGE